MFFPCRCLVHNNLTIFQRYGVALQNTCLNTRFGFCFVMLRTEPRALHRLGKDSTMGLHSSPINRLLTELLGSLPNGHLPFLLYQQNPRCVWAALSSAKNTTFPSLPCEVKISDLQDEVSEDHCRSSASLICCCPLSLPVCLSVRFVFYEWEFGGLQIFLSITSQFGIAFKFQDGWKANF
jgi:hypothetical protein